MKHITAIIFGVAIIVAAALLGNAYVNRAQTQDVISVTGLGTKDFTSDLIVWECQFSSSSYELKDAYSALEKDKAMVREYLISKGVKAEDIVFQSVNTQELSDSQYDDGRYIGSVFRGYQLSQSVTIESTEVLKVEALSREITELLNQGVQVYSSSPRYYYTKMADLKIEMIAKATEDARVRAEQIAMNSGGNLGDLKSAKMGVFQITGQNSNEDYSWGGSFNTSSKNKTASITMRLEYKIN